MSDDEAFDIMLRQFRVCPAPGKTSRPDEMVIVLLNTIIVGRC